MRNMDELFTISTQIGKICGLCSLVFKEESNMPGEVELEKFEEPAEEEVKEAAQPVGDDDAEDAPADAPPVDDAEDKKPKWNPKDYTWTISNR